MSSPYRPRSSPSRSHSNGLHPIQRNSPVETQSSLLFEDMSRLFVDDDRLFRRKLDEEALLQRQRHVEALKQALAKHEAVRKSAEHTCEAEMLKAERELIAQEAEHLRKLEEERRKLEEAKEAERHRVEQVRRMEQERKRQAEQIERERKAAEEARIKQEKEESDARRKAAEDQAEAERKSKEAAVARDFQQRQQQQEAQAHSVQPIIPQLNGATPGPAGNVVVSAQGLVSDENERMRTHNVYLQIHARLKALRAEIRQIKTRDSRLYEELKTHQQGVNKILGQLVKHDNAANSQKIKTLKEAHWEWSIGVAPSETVDINLFRLEPVESFHVPKLFIWMVNNTCKAIIRQMGVECASDPAFATPLGILTAQIFAQPSCKPQGHTMVDIFWAKFHKAHPVLFGCFGSEQTTKDRELLGWRADWDQTEAFARFRGMSRAFAAVTMRDFAKSKQDNPFPNRVYWAALSRILNTPADRQLAIHYLSLEGLLDPVFIPRYLQLYGQIGLAVLRTATKEFPQRRDRNKKMIGQRAGVIENFPDRYENELNLKL